MAVVSCVQAIFVDSMIAKVALECLIIALRVGGPFVAPTKGTCDTFALRPVAAPVAPTIGPEAGFSCGAAGRYAGLPVALVSGSHKSEPACAYYQGAQHLIGNFASVFGLWNMNSNLQIPSKIFDRISEKT
jgi:hypothetical protein